MKRIFTQKNKNTLMFVGVALALVILCGAVMNLYGAFDKKEANPENLVGIEAIGEDDYPISKEGNTGYGVTIDVNDLGAIKVKGTATGADLVWDVCTVKLAAGTYTLTAGVDDVSKFGYAVRLDDGKNGYIYADIDDTFTVSAETTYTLQVYVAEDTKVNTTFYPVLVEGASEGDFYD